MNHLSIFDLSGSFLYVFQMNFQIDIHKLVILCDCLHTQAYFVPIVHKPAHP